MCRHLAYLGTSRSLASLLIDPPHALYQQSWAPREQRHGTVNADGFGAGWYVDGRAEPVRYRRAQPIWADASFASLAPTIASTCLLAAVRSATPGLPVEESGAAPFTHGRWLFSHNGRLADWVTARKALGAAVADAPDALAPVDSALLFGLALARWQAGAALHEGLLATARDVLGVGGGRLTMLAADGTSLAGLVVGEPLWVSRTGQGTVLAAEPHDDGPWHQLPDLTLVHVTRHGIAETHLTLSAFGTEH
jgi:glutamine amidotransferase